MSQIELKLFKITFKPKNRGITYTSSGGFIFILADTPDMAKYAWLCELARDYIKCNPAASNTTVEGWKTYWETQWQSTLLIHGPFINGFVINERTI